MYQRSTTARRRQTLRARRRSNSHRCRCCFGSHGFTTIESTRCEKLTSQPMSTSLPPPQTTTMTTASRERRAGATLARSLSACPSRRRRRRCNRRSPAARRRQRQRSFVNRIYVVRTTSTTRMPTQKDRILCRASSPVDAERRAHERRRPVSAARRASSRRAASRETTATPMSSPAALPLYGHGERKSVRASEIIETGAICNLRTCSAIQNVDQASKCCVNTQIRSTNQPTTRFAYTHRNTR